MENEGQLGIHIVSLFLLMHFQYGSADEDIRGQSTADHLQLFAIGLLIGVNEELLIKILYISFREDLKAACGHQLGKEYFVNYGSSLRKGDLVNEWEDGYLAASLGRQRRQFLNNRDLFPAAGQEKKKEK